MLNHYFNIHRFLLLTLLFLLLFYSCFQTQEAPGIVTNTLEEIDAVEGKIKLNLVYVWGDDETEDINQVFRYPSDINIDAKGRIFIVDYGRNRIQVFDKSRKFIRTIGETGLGPGNFRCPKKVVFTSNNNIVALDSHNYRIQVFNPEGRYLDSFRTGKKFLQNFSITPKDELLMYLPKKEDEKTWAISSYGLKGKPIKDVYAIPCRDREFTYGTSHGGNRTIKECEQQPISFLSDSRGDIFVSYVSAPVFQRLSGSGNLKKTVAYEVPFKAFKISLGPGSIVPKASTEEEKRMPGIAGNIAIDGKGRIFLITSARRSKKEDTIFLVGGRGNVRRVPKEFPEESDMYRLLVFNDKGKIIAAKKLSVYCSRMVVHGDRLYIVDQFIHSRIHEYTFEL